jgi:hypothetical protein
LRILIGVVAAVALLAGAPVALAHQGNPNYRSVVKQVTPGTPNLHLSVLNFDDRLLMENFSGKPVVIMGYDDKPYARVLADRTVQVNTNSPAYYLNGDRTASETVPKGLPSTPHWQTESRSGRFEWHDHRMHWMGAQDPPQLKDKSKRTHIFDWRVPITVGGTPGKIAGTLTWVPLGGGSVPVALIGGVTIVLIALSLWVFAIRRRRFDAAADGADAGGADAGGGDGADGADGGDRSSGAAAEAW